MRNLLATFAAAVTLLVVGATQSCSRAPTQGPSPTPSPSVSPAEKPPSPGPIIIIEPEEENGVTQLKWLLPTGYAAQKANTTPGYLRLDAFGAVKTFKLYKKNGPPIDLTDLMFQVREASGTRVIEISKGASGNFSWKSGGASLQVCDMGEAVCIPDCANHDGLPAEFFLPLASINWPNGIALADVDHVEIEADYVNPCP